MCILPRAGCSDRRALNFASWARWSDRAGCLYAGCMHKEAFNFDPTARLDDGTCVFFGPLPASALRLLIAPVAQPAAPATAQLAAPPAPRSEPAQPAGRRELQSTVQSPTAPPPANPGNCPASVLALATGPFCGANCQLPVCGCALLAATNYDSTVTYTIASSCRVPGCLDTSATNFDPHSDHGGSGELRLSARGLSSGHGG